MGDNFYTYESENFVCKHCGWTGLGKEVEQGEMFHSGFEVDCPNCHERFPGLIQFPTIEETLEKGSEEDKLVAAAMKLMREKWLASLLKNVSQLPDLHFDFMAFVLREIEENGENYIVITHQGRIIWKEIRAYEYFERFIEIGRIFKEKYGERMIDLVPDVDGDYLYGDGAVSTFLVEKFRRELRSK
jgi:hypothetical protein